MLSIVLAVDSVIPEHTSVTTIAVTTTVTPIITVTSDTTTTTTTTITTTTTNSSTYYLLPTTSYFYLLLTTCFWLLLSTYIYYYYYHYYDHDDALMCPNANRPPGEARLAVMLLPIQSLMHEAGWRWNLRASVRHLALQRGNTSSACVTLVWAQTSTAWIDTSRYPMMARAWVAETVWHSRGCPRMKHNVLKPRGLHILYPGIRPVLSLSCPVRIALACTLVLAWLGLAWLLLAWRIDSSWLDWAWPVLAWPGLSWLGLESCLSLDCLVLAGLEPLSWIAWSLVETLAVFLHFALMIFVKKNSRGK